MNRKINVRPSNPLNSYTPAASHLYSLDFARGVAALAVVLWHWQHFFFNGPVSGAFQREEQPFYSVLFLFYEKGWLPLISSSHCRASYFFGCTLTKFGNVTSLLGVFSFCVCRDSIHYIWQLYYW
jgi:hypothetical protein